MFITIHNIQIQKKNWVHHCTYSTYVLLCGIHSLQMRWAIRHIHLCLSFLWETSKMQSRRFHIPLYQVVVNLEVSRFKYRHYFAFVQNKYYIIIFLNICSYLEILAKSFCKNVILALENRIY